MPRLRRGVPVEIAGRNKDAGSGATRVSISDPLKPDKRMRGQCRACGRSEKVPALGLELTHLSGINRSWTPLVDAGSLGLRDAQQPKHHANESERRYHQSHLVCGSRNTVAGTNHVECTHGFMFLPRLGPVANGRQSFDGPVLTQRESPVRFEGCRYHTSSHANDSLWALRLLGVLFRTVSIPIARRTHIQLHELETAAAPGR